MRHKRLKLSATLLLGLALTGLQAQEIVNTAGGNATGGEGIVSYSVGQVVYTTNSGTNGTVAQGVQQPYEISVVTEIPDGPDVRLEFTTYPNPTSHFLTLRFGGVLASGYHAMLYDSNGKLCAEKEITSNDTLFDLFSLVTGTYFLKLNKSNNEIKTFKIIKT